MDRTTNASTASTAVAGSAGSSRTRSETSGACPGSPEPAGSASTGNESTTWSLLLQAKDTIIEHQAELLRSQSTICQCQRSVLEAQRLELAERRLKDRLIDAEPWGFALFLLLKDVWPFSLWYHRFD